MDNVFDQKIYVDLSGYREGITPVTSDLGGQSIGLARVIVPQGVDRDQYVSDCYRTGRVDLFDENQGVYLKQCFVTNEVLANIKFPRGVGDIGDPVVWVAQPMIFNHPMVVGTFPSGERMRLGTDQTVAIHKEWNKGYVDITADAKDGSLNVVVHGQEKSGGVVNVSVLGDEQSILNVKSDGLVSVESGRELRVRSYEKIDVQLENPENQDLTGVVVTKDSVDVAANYSHEDDAEKVDYTKIHLDRDGLTFEEHFDGDESTEYSAVLTKDGVTVNSAIKSDDAQYAYTVTDEECKVTFKDIIFSLKEKLAMLQQGDDTKVELKNGKVAIVNSGTGLNDILSTFVDTIEKLTVATSMGPSGTPLPPTIQATTQLKQKLNQFFNE